MPGVTVSSEDSQMISSSGALRYRISSTFSPFLCTLKNALATSTILQYPQSLHNPKSKPLHSSTIQRIDRDVCVPNCSRFSTMSTGGGDSRGAVSFKLSPSSFLKIQKGDITKWAVDGSSDAIVNPANERMLGGGGADGAIHDAAGPELRAACSRVPEVLPGVRCPTGEARITPGFRLPASHVIHTVGPIYNADKNPEASLRNAYKNSLRVAKESNIQYVAFPAISCGVFRYPLEEAATVALSTVKEFGNDMKEVHFVLFSDDICEVWLIKAKDLFEKV